MIVSMFEVDPFKDFINLIYDSTDSIKLVFTDSGLKINLLNNSHVCFYNVEFKKEYFDLYEIDDVEEYVFDSKDLFMVLKSVAKGDVLTISCEDNSNAVFLFENEDKRRQFSIGVIDELYDSPVPPSIDYDLDFILDWTDLKQCCTDLDKIVGTDRFKLTAKDDGLYVSSVIGTMKDYSNQLNSENYSHEYSTVVNLSYISELSKLSKNGELLLHMGDSIPLSWEIDGYDVRYSGLIAPIMQEDE